MDTAARWRILVLSLLVIAGAVYLFTRNDPRLQPGMTSAPCTSDGESVTGCGIDDWAGLCRYRAENALLLEQQRENGSWENEISPEYETAMACLILQMPNSYLPIFQR